MHIYPMQSPGEPRNTTHFFDNDQGAYSPDLDAPVSKGWDSLNQKRVMSSVHEPSHLKVVTISKKCLGTSSFHPEVDNIYPII